MKPLPMPWLAAAAASMLVACAAPRPADTIRTSGDRLYDQGQFDAAAAEYVEVVDRYPGDWQAQYQLGRCYLELDRPAEARRALEIAHTRRPENEEVTDALAEAIFRQGDESRLFAFLRERAESMQTVHGWLRLGRYAQEMGDPDSAKLAIETAIRIDEGRSVTPYLAAATFAERLGRMDEAVRRLRQAYGIDPHDEEVKRRLRALGEVPGPTIALPPGT